jgi:hypothetical protein
MSLPTVTLSPCIQDAQNSPPVVTGKAVLDRGAATRQRPHGTGRGVKAAVDTSVDGILLQAPRPLTEAESAARGHGRRPAHDGACTAQRAHGPSSLRSRSLTRAACSWTRPVRARFVSEQSGGHGVARWCRSCTAGSGRAARVAAGRRGRSLIGSSGRLREERMFPSMIAFRRCVARSTRDRLTLDLDGPVVTASCPAHVRRCRAVATRPGAPASSVVHNAACPSRR